LLRRTQFILSHPIFKISVFHNTYTYSTYLLVRAINYYVVVITVVILVAVELVVTVSISDALDLPALFTA